MRGGGSANIGLLIRSHHWRERSEAKERTLPTLLGGTAADKVRGPHRADTLSEICKIITVLADGFFLQLCNNC